MVCCIVLKNEAIDYIYKRANYYNLTSYKQTANKHAGLFAVNMRGYIKFTFENITCAPLL